MQKSSIWVGYVRLSRDDNNGNLESMSIANQKQILLDYAQEKGWDIVKIYSDDGFSGTNFDRPGFKQMIADIELGGVTGVITKDLSRLGRNYSMTGYYTDEYFPEKNIRFIAINDGVDTYKDYNDFAAFHNVINEYYPREVSRKVRQVKKKNAQMGKFMGSQAPYGYDKSPEDKHQLIVDEYAASIVRRIYQEFLAGNSGQNIANRLNIESISCPREYHYQKIGKKNPLNQNDKWGSSMIMSILKNRVYAGDMVQGKREVISFKTKKRRQTNPEEWIIVENTHEAIIDYDKWTSVQKMTKTKRKQKTPKGDRPSAVLTGLVFCKDCDNLMSAALIGRKGTLTYRCGRYIHYGKNACSSHSIPAEILEGIVLNELKMYAHIAHNDRKAMVQEILSFLKSDMNCSTSQLKKNVTKAEAKINELKATIKDLYSEKIKGKLSEKMFYTLMNDYEQELDEWEKKLINSKDELDEQDCRDKSITQLVDIIESVLEMDKLSRAMAMAVIDRVIVSERYSQNGQQSQNVEIEFKFAGKLNKLFPKQEKSIA